MDCDSTRASQRMPKDSAEHREIDQSLGPSGEALGKANTSAQNQAYGIHLG